MNPLTALIAEDEPLLSQSLVRELTLAWPALQLLPPAANGIEAVALALQTLPDVLFFDIRMPGLSGLDAVAELADAWPAHKPLPQIVFVTAFDHYATQAFDAQALDYIVKPVQPQRLAKTVARLQARLALAQAPSQSTLPEAAKLAQNEASQAAQLHQLGLLLQQIGLQTGQPTGTNASPLVMLQATRGNRIDMVPLVDVLVVEAADKYLRVLTATQEHWVRLSLRELLGRLRPDEFWQIHRSVVVRAQAIESATRDESGKLSLRLRQRSEVWQVSRLFAHHFR